MIIKPFIPMEPISTNEIPVGTNWIHQVKWDGIRGISYLNANSIKILTKRGFDRTTFYPELSEVINLIKAREVVLDGEMVVFDKQGRPSFSDILVRERVRSTSKLKHYVNKYPVKYIIFDILSLNGNNLTHLPLCERLKLLNDNVKRNNNITITDNFENGLSLFDLMKEQSYEGIVSKNLDSAYTGGKKHSAWFKIKFSKKLLAVVGGIRYKNNYPNSLMIGIYRNEQFEYIGNVGTGLKAKDLQLLNENIEQLKTDKSPFSNRIENQASDIWIKPILTCWINFLEWTSTGSLRHPKLIGFSPLKADEARGIEYTFDS